jgi:CHASE3 domain sensor protein
MQSALLDHPDAGFANIWKVGCDIERELTTANAEIERLTNKVAQLYEGAEQQKQHIKRLEEAGDVLCENSNPSRWDLPEAAARKLTEQSNWIKAKEAKP